jgi:hypothetical protein
MEPPKSADHVANICVLQVYIATDPDFVLHALWYTSSVEVFIFSSIYKIVWMPIIKMEQPPTNNRATKKSKNGGLQ